MKYLATLAAAGASLIAISSASAAENPAPVQADAQDAQAEQVDQRAEAEGEIIVTARRKNESLQDVPLTVNAVTAEDVAKLNIRRFEDIATVVPGLSLGNNANGIGATASVRGVAFDVNASGNNGTVEFYLNDSPISAGNLFQAMFDIGQIELLRGPQGTLRGRASPSGSMTVTTHQAELDGWGGYVNATATSIGGINANAAINVPIIRDMLAIRVSGIVDHNEANRVHSVNNGIDPYSKTRGVRASFRFDPTDSITITGTYQKLIQNLREFDQVESLRAVDPTAPASPLFISASDRLAVADSPRQIKQIFENANLQAQWSFAGQRLNYAGAMNKQHFLSQGADDQGDFFPSTFLPFTKGYGQFTDSNAKAWAHELRLSSDEMLFGMVDYVVGVFQQKLNSPTDLNRATLVYFGLPSAVTPGTIVNTPIARRGNNKEQSAFANVTLHFGDRTELAGGVRYIDYQSVGSLFVGGVEVPGARENVDFNTWIYSASIKHEFSDDLMVYANTGSSWRPGLSATGDFSLARSPREDSFVTIAPEKSKSYEVGFKASAMDKRLRFNVSAFHQKFDNYPYRAPGNGVYFVETTALLPAVQTRVNRFNFVAAVPVTVNGVEAEVAFAPTRDWDINLSGSYAKGKIKNGVIPCNDYARVNPDGTLTPGVADGLPDPASFVPTVGQIQSATGGDTIAACTVNQRSAQAPLWTLTGQTEYRAPITDSINGFGRALVTVYGDSQNDPTNAVDDVKAYALLNLFAGIRSPDGNWEISVYGKNVTNTGRVLSRTNGPLTTPYNIGATSVTGTTTYYGVNYTRPREFGLNIRYAFGTR